MPVFHIEKPSKQLYEAWYRLAKSRGARTPIFTCEALFVVDQFGALAGAVGLHRTATGILVVEDAVLSDGYRLIDRRRVASFIIAEVKEIARRDKLLVLCWASVNSVAHALEREGFKVAPVTPLFFEG